MEITGTAAYKYMSQGTKKTDTTQSDPSQLGKDQFLQLLATQLSYQDPLNPMSNDQFIAQMAQFSSLEQMYNLNKTMTNYINQQGNMQVLNLLGMNVKAEQMQTIGDTTTVEEITGMVYKVDLKDSDPKLILSNGKTVKLSEVKETSLPVYQN